MNLWTLIYLVVVGAALIGGAVSIVVTLPKVPAHWKPVYWMGLGAVTAFIAVFILVAIRQMVPGAFGPQVATYALEVAVFMVALLFILVPFVHRLEAAKRAEAVGDPILQDPLDEPWEVDTSEHY